MKEIAVVVSTYNRLKYLKLSLQSWKWQTLKDFEIIVVDDGSSDGTKEWMAGQPHKYCWQPDNGYDLAGARNMGIKAANAKRILFTDNDLIHRPETLELHSQLPAEAIGISYIHWLGRGHGLMQRDDLPPLQWFRGMLEHRELRDMHHKPENCWGGAVSYSMEQLRRAGGFDQAGFHNKYGFEDIDLAYRCIRSPIPGNKARVQRVYNAIAYHIWHPFAKYRDEVPGNQLGGKRIRQGYYDKVHYGPLKGKI